MNKLVIAVSVALLTGCTTPMTASVAPNYEARFGNAVRDAKLKMTINPDAGKKPDQVRGMDGVAARESINRYHESFKSPPPVTNVINIGGGIGGGTQ